MKFSTILLVSFLIRNQSCPEFTVFILLNTVEQLACYKNINEIN